MDDDAPLAMLVKAPRFDDDTPLASLADSARKKAGAGKPGAKAAGAPKPGVVKLKLADKKSLKKNSSSSSSSSGSSSSSSGKKGKTGKGKPLKKGKASNATAEGDETQEFEPLKKRSRSTKEEAVAEFLCRWWYALPDWPPEDPAYYNELLVQRKLRTVSFDDWEWVPETDEKGFRKVYGLTQFRGLFRNSAGDLIDLRPKETCPCYATFMKKELPQIYQLLVSAYEAQLKALQESKFNEEKLQDEIKVHLTRVRNKLHQASAVSSTKRG